MIEEASNEQKDYTPHLWAAASCCFSTFGICLVVAALIVNDPDKLFKLVYGALLIGSGSALLGTCILAGRRYGLFSKPNTKDLNENTVLVSIENKM